MAKSATPYPCPTASGCSLTVTDSLGTSATVNLGPPKYRPPLDHAGRGLGVRVLARMFRSGLGYVMRGPFDFRLDRVFEYGLRGLLDDTDVRRRAGSAQAP